MDEQHRAAFTPETPVQDEHHEQRRLHDASEVYQGVVSVAQFVVGPPYPVENVERSVGAHQAHVHPCVQARENVYSSC